MTRRTRLQGAVDAVRGAARDGLATIEDVHTAIARQPFAALRLVPGVGAVSEIVRGVHDTITSGIYGAIRAGIETAAAATKAAAAGAGVEDREPRAGSAADLAIAAINGVAGDRLERDGNPLAVTMALRHGDDAIAPRRDALAAAFPHASSRLALFVHGLADNESTWRFYAREHYGDEGATYGSRLRDDLGYTPL